MASVNQLSRKKLKKLRFKHKLNGRIKVPTPEIKQLEELEKSNQPLPENVLKVEDEYFYIPYDDLDQNELSEYLQLLALSKLDIIKNCLLTLTVLGLIPVVYGVIWYLMNYKALY